MNDDDYDEFSSALVKHVRDRSVRELDNLLAGKVVDAVASRWGTLSADMRAQLHDVIPDVVDVVVSELLYAVDQQTLPLSWRNGRGDWIDLFELGMTEMVGSYLMDDPEGWRVLHSETRYNKY